MAILDRFYLYICYKIGTLLVCFGYIVKLATYLNEHHMQKHPAIRSFSGSLRCSNKVLKMNNTHRFCLGQEMQLLLEAFVKVITCPVFRYILVSEI